MPVGKTLVRCRCHGRIALGLDQKSPWEDVWLQWESDPGEAATTLMSRPELVADLKSSRELSAEDPANPHWIARVAQQKELLDALSRAPCVIGEPARPTYIYTHADALDRAEAERMLAFFLRERHGIEDPVFEWDELSPESVIQTIGFGEGGTPGEADGEL